jgi:predicted unusual protein kinase regulating ubiquinone biosynthesis (AarF/ABC1/UbiB family)
MRLYRIMLRDVEPVSAPVPVEELCTSRLLTMTWLQGRGLQSVLDETPAPAARARVAEGLFKAWYVPFYRFGVIHGDPHPGNYQVRPDGGVNLLDYGAVRVFNSSFVRGVIDLYEAVRDDDAEKIRHAYECWGFTDLTKEKMDALTQWARFLYEPLMQDRVRRIQEGDDALYGKEVAARVHQALQKAGGVRPPREFVLMDRSAIGLGSVFVRLGAELNWHRLFQEMIADFDAGALAARQQAALREARVPGPA